MKSKRPTFEEARARYVHRYTMEYFPLWARARGPGGSFYAPQFRSDREWYDNTKFPGEPGNLHVPGSGDCFTTGQTWPLGKWLEQPYREMQQTTFAVLPRALRQTIEPRCVCSFCKAHPDLPSQWDTLAFDPADPKRTWTVHYPEFCFGAPS